MTGRTPGTARRAGIAAAVATALALASCAGDNPKPAARSGCSEAPVRLTTAAVVTLPGRPADVVADSRGAWVSLGDRGAVVAVAAGTDRAGPAMPAGRTPGSLALGDDRVWVTDRDGSRVRALDPATGRLRAAPTRVDVPTDVAVGAERVWVTSLDDGYVASVDPRTGGVGPTPLVPGRVVSHVAVGGGTVWVAATADRSVTRIDAASARPPDDPIAVGLRSISALTASSDTVWVGDADAPRVRRIDRRETWVRGPLVTTAGSPRGLALDACRLYVAGAGGEVSVHDSATGAALSPAVRAGRSAGSLAVAGNILWVTDPRGNRLVRFEIAPA
jgi:outer membrane protein assembly factor BamB